ncbi:MAG TPA: hypothetical protein PLV64_05990 [Anaerolineales bacterium]|nr:hypothetical protein [Anaerolineales bacterium]
MHPVSASLRGANCLTLGQIPRTGWLDGFAVPAPAQACATKWRIP